MATLDRPYSFPYMKKGDACVVAPLKDALLKAADEICGNVYVVKARVIKDSTAVQISRWLLEQEPEGISVKDCVCVSVDADVDKKLILERLEIRNCVKILCSPDQKDAVAAVCTDVAAIRSPDEDAEEDTAEEKTEQEEVKVTKINAGEYTL